MDFIVFDLEWNQCPEGKEKENSKIPFEIVEIGAVKLSQDRNIIDTFHTYVSPVVYRELHHVTKDIIQVSMEDLDKGKNFQEAAMDFYSWCGEECTYVTWGSMDLTELQRNCRFFNVRHKFPMPLKYYDLQKLFSICYDDGKSRIALETAIEQIQIEKDNTFHSAMNDAMYTAEIFHKIDFDKVQTYSSVDTYVIPAKRNQEYTLNYGTYSKYVSHGFADKDALMRDGVILSTQCSICGQNAKKKIKWFTTNQKMYYAVAVCKEHGLLRCKLKIKKTDDDQFYVTKIIKPTDENGIITIRQKQMAARIKRREKRKRLH